MGGGARALVWQPKTAVFLPKSPKPPRRQGVKDKSTDTEGVEHLRQKK